MAVGTANTMKDVSAPPVRQPWAWAIVHGGKDVENRSWRTSHRGPLCIHAGRAFAHDAYPKVLDLSTRVPPDLESFDRGALIGVVDLFDCVFDQSESDWAIPGAWHWLLRDARPLETPIPCNGRLRLWHPAPMVDV